MFRIEMLEANEGDALWVEFGDPAAPRRMLIDCGYKSTYRTVLERLDADPGLNLELFVLTHIDADHIAGAVPFISDARVTPARVKDVWFNSRKHLDDRLGAEQAEYFTHHLERKQFNWNRQFNGSSIVVPDHGDLPEIEVGDLRLTLLSPSRGQLRTLADHWDAELEEVMTRRGVETVDELIELPNRRLEPDRLGAPNVQALASEPFEPDDRPPNGSSIAFLAEFKDAYDHDRDKAVLFTGDAHSPMIEASLRRLLAKRGLDRLRVDALKLSHHGSKKNTSKDLLALISCKRFLFSTNGVKHDHPNLQCVARIVVARRPGVELYFNYETKFNDPWKARTLQREYRYTAHYPTAGVPGIRVEI